MKKISILIAGIFLLNICQAQNIELKLNLEAGKKYIHNSNCKSTSIIDYKSTKMAVLLTLKSRMSFMVNAINSTGYDMQVQYENLSMEMELPQGNMVFSSKMKNDPDILSRLLAAMTKRAFTIKMSNAGKIEEIKGVDSLFVDMFKSFPELTEDKIAQLKSQLDKSFGGESIKGNLEMATSIFPDKPVSIGGKWKIITKLESTMPVNAKTTFELKEVNREYYLVHGDSKLENTDKKAYIETNGTYMRFDMKGTSVSDIKLDKISGWIIEAQINQLIQGDSFIKESYQFPDGMKMPMIMKNELTITAD